MIDVAVCMAAHNRRDQTLACLASLFAVELPPATTLTVFLLDDGSSDGTAEAIAESYPDVRLLKGDGQLYWGGGMRAAYGAALAEDFDQFIWLNDDVQLKPDALIRLLACHDAMAARYGGDHLVVGAMQDPQSGGASYSGRVRATWTPPWKLKCVTPDPDAPTPCDTINGNLVLIPRSLALKLGNIDRGFAHSFGDHDYGFRARKAGARLWVAAGYAGWCAPNTSRPRYKRPGLTLRERFAMINTPLGCPMGEQFRYATRHYPLSSPVFVLAPYVMLLVEHFVGRFSRTSPASH